MDNNALLELLFPAMQQAGARAVMADPIQAYLQERHAGSLLNKAADATQTPATPQMDPIRTRAYGPSKGEPAVSQYETQGFAESGAALKFAEFLQALGLPGPHTPDVREYGKNNPMKKDKP